MEPCNKNLPLNYHPQQKEFTFEGIKFTSQFDSGNLFNVDRVDDVTVRMNIFIYKYLFSSIYIFLLTVTVRNIHILTELGFFMA